MTNPLTSDAELVERLRFLSDAIENEFNPRELGSGPSVSILDCVAPMREAAERLSHPPEVSGDEIERVARAMHDADFRQQLAERQWEDNPEQAWWLDMARAAIAALTRAPSSLGSMSGEAAPLSFAWTATQDYGFYPPYVNLSGNRLAVRGPEGTDGEHPQPGLYVAVDLPPEAISELRAALAQAPRPMNEGEE